MCVKGGRGGVPKGGGVLSEGVPQFGTHDEPMRGSGSWASFPLGSGTVYNFLLDVMPSLGTKVMQWYTGACAWKNCVDKLLGSTAWQTGRHFGVEKCSQSYIQHSMGSSLGHLRRKSAWKIRCHLWGKKCSL